MACCAGLGLSEVNGHMKTWPCPDLEMRHFPLQSVLFVCTGNICRSPTAERLFQRLLPEEYTMEVGSAGVHAIEGNPALRDTVSATREMGLDLSDHRARLLNLDMIRSADLILAMEASHCADVLRKDPDAGGKVLLLGCYSRAHDAPNREIEDPYGASLDMYRRCFAEIRDCVENLMNVLLSGDKRGPDRS